MSQDCLVDIIITMNKNCKGGTDMAQQKEGDSMGLFKKKNVKKSYDRELILKNAPEKEAGCVSVPQTVE